MYTIKKLTKMNSQIKNNVHKYFQINTYLNKYINTYLSIY